MAKVKRVAVIGAGASGLTAIKCCLDENLEPVCFERSDYISGLWHYTNEIEENQACVMKSTVINTSKEMMSYSDFPIPKEYPFYMHNKYVDRYFHLYANEFGLKKYIRFKTEVLHVEKGDDFQSSGKWNIKIRDKTTEKEESFEFDAVLVCTGHHAEKNVPDFRGLSDFQGKVVHTHDYKTPESYDGKRVVVIGIGNSGGDVSVELSRVASQVFLSTRRGAWIIYRIVENGVPIDMARSTRFIAILRDLLPLSVIERLVQKQLNRRFDHAAYSLQPKHGVTATHPTINDALPNQIATGSIKIKPNVRKFTKTGVEFTDGTFEDDIDAVILGTGYIFGFPFIDKSIIEVKKNKVDLYMLMFPPEFEHQTMAIIGCFQPLGAIMPVAEMQCRLATRVFKGDVTLPSRDLMREEIHNRRTKMAQQYVESQRHTIQIDYVKYMDELAELNGCKPNLKKMFLKDPKLAYTCLFGPCTPYQFRLTGPGKWTGAREAILTQWDRTLYPLKTRPLGFKPEKSSNVKLMFYFVFVLFLAWLVMNIFFGLKHD